MKSTILVFMLAAVAAHAADRSLGQLPNGQLYVKDEIQFCLKAASARALSRTDSSRQKVATSSLVSLHPAIDRVVGNHLSAERWLNGEPLPVALRHEGPDVPVIARSLTAMLVPSADAAVVVEELRKHPDVEWASLNVLEPVTEIPNDPFWTNQWGLTRINVTNGWDVAQATTTMRVAIVDTGVDLTHPDLNIVYNRGFGGNPNGDAMRDVRGGDSIDHGTHVAGIAAATRNNGIGIAGVARLGIMAMGCAAWSTNAAGVAQYRIASAEAAINDAIANGAHVINCSFGQSAPLSAAMSNALQNAYNNGVIVVCAAGNDGTNILNSPSAGWAAHFWPIIVSNIQQGTNDPPSSDSNFGNRIDLAAPGANIYSTVTTNYNTPAAGGTYNYMSGTSMAAPHVAGAAGMLRSLNPLRLGTAGTKDLLNRMAQDLGPSGKDPVYGFGMLQLPASFLAPLKSANTFTGPGPSSQSGTYDNPYINLSTAIAATPSGGTIVLNGGLTGAAPSYPAQTLNTPMTYTAFPDRPVTFGN